MVAETSVSNSIDPLNDVGALLFPRSLRATADDDSLHADSNHLESLHTFMKNANDIGSPEMLRNESMRVVDGGPELLESDFAMFAKSVGMTDAIGAKGKDKPQERRQGLDRKKRSFSLKTSSSQPPVNLEPNLKDEQFQDPDAFFDAYASYENTKKEIQIAMGGSRDASNQDNLSTRVRGRRPGILGKSYSIKHRYLIPSPEKVDRLISFVEEVEEGTKSAGEDGNDAQEISDPDLDLVVDMAEAELSVSVEKADDEVKDILDEFLARNEGELDGEGAMNILQEHLKMKPLDLGSLCIPVSHGYGRSSILSAGKLKSRRSSLAIDNVLKNVNKSPIVRESAAQNPDIPLSSPTPPINMFASVSSLLKKRTQESSSPKDPFSPLDTEFSECQNTSSAEPIDKLQEQVHTEANLSMSSELNSESEVAITEHTHNMGEQNATGCEGSLRDKFVDETANILIGNAENRQNEVPGINDEETMNAQERMIIDNWDSSSLIQNEAVDNLSTKGTKQPMVKQVDLQKVRKEVSKKRTRNMHPMRKSIAEAGTSFEDGVRRSKRIKMRPLEYWKGEKKLYGRLNDSGVKLLGVRCFSPGNSRGDLTVKPYIPARELSKYKELLDKAARI